jgi:hypothetical protein
MGVDRHERTPGAFTSLADLDLDAFIELCERAVDADAVPTASEIVRQVPVYTAEALRSAATADRRAIMAELNGCLLDGPGALAVRDVIDPAVVDAASAIYRELIDEEADAGRAAGDHFAAAGKNDGSGTRSRSWPSARRRPSSPTSPTRCSTWCASRGWVRVTA